jgi:DNA-nicking Smr family endonuclease
VAPSDASRAKVATARAKSPPLAHFDRRQARQIASGKVEVDARIDLHGLYQREAYARLRAFLTDAHARALKRVLVITGKGGAEPPDRLGELAGERRRGVLRHSLPHWLEEPELRSIVASFTQAGVRHGGAGAFYVQLRRGR